MLRREEVNKVWKNRELFKPEVGFPITSSCRVIWSSLRPNTLRYWVVIVGCSSIVTGCVSSKLALYTLSTPLPSNICDHVVRSLECCTVMLWQNFCRTGEPRVTMATTSYWVRKSIWTYSSVTDCVYELGTQASALAVSELENKRDLSKKYLQIQNIFCILKNLFRNRSFCFEHSDPDAWTDEALSCAIVIWPLFIPRGPISLSL